MPSHAIPNPNPDAPELDPVARALAMTTPPDPPLPSATPDLARAAIAAARVAIDRAHGAGSGVGRRPARRVLPADLRHELDDVEPF